MNRRCWEDARPGTELPEIALEISLLRATMHVGAGRDFMRDHYDVDHARGGGHPSVFVNTCFHQSLADRIVTDWAGPQVRLLRRRLRMLAPLYAGETATVAATVTARQDPEQGVGSVDFDIRIMAAGQPVSVAQSSFVFPRRNGEATA